MKIIGDIVKLIDEEIEGAKCYAEKYIEHRANGMDQWADRFHQMAKDELQHANVLHEYAVGEIEKVNKVFKPRADMQKMWDESHKKYVDCVAWVEEMLNM